MKIIAHRGLSASYSENTLLAFQKAFEAGADGIETDLRLSCDNEIVLFHDAALSKLTGEKGSVETSTLSELKRYEVKGEKIATLDELLSLARGKYTLILEIKYDPKTYQALCDILVEKIADRKSWVEVSCFEDRVLMYMHQLDTAIRLHKIIDEVSVMADFDFEKKYDFVFCFDINVSLRKETLQMGLIKKYKVIFWTVDAEDLTTEKNAGLYGIMVNNISKGNE